MPVAVAEKGLKRICPSCGTHYYDLNKRPVICPGCSTEFTGETKVKTRRGRPVAIEDDKPVNTPATAARKGANEEEDEEDDTQGVEVVSLDDVDEKDDDTEDGTDESVLLDEDDALDDDLDDEDDDLDDDMDDDLEDDEEGEEDKG